MKSSVYVQKNHTEEKFKKIAVIAEGSKGWNLELNLVSWGGRPAKYDIREWAPDHSRMAKGLTFTAEELGELRRLLENLDLPTEDLPD